MIRANESILNIVRLLMAFIMLSNCSDSQFRDLGSGYSLARISEEQVFISKRDYGSEDPVIIPKVVAFTSIRGTIFAKQFKLPYQEGFYRETPGEFAFWILNTSSEKLYGPFSYPEFQAKTKELGFEDIVLKPVR